MSSIRRLGMALILTGLLSPFVERSLAEEVDSPATQVGQWIVLLEGRNFAERQRAIGELIHADANAVSPVAKAAEGGEPELVKSCVGILKRIQTDGSDEGKTAAESALKTLSRSSLPQVANAASAALKGEGEMAVPAARAGVGNINVRLNQNGVRVAVRIVNGHRTVNVNEADREIEIQDVEGKKIKMSIVQTTDGKKETKSYNADDLDDLKRQNMDAAALYEKYVQRNAVQIQFRAVPPAINALPRKPGGGAGGEAGAKIEAALKRLAAVRIGLEKLQEKTEPDPDALEELLNELKQAEKELFAAQGSLGR